MNKERYTTENMGVKRDLVLIKDSNNPIPLTPWDCAEKLNNLESQLAEARDMVKEAARDSFDAMCDGGFCSMTFDEFWEQSKYNTTKGHNDE